MAFVLISNSGFAQSPPAAAGPRLEGRAPAAPPQLPWYDKPDFLSAITSIGALFISILALVLTSRSTSAQERETETRRAAEHPGTAGHAAGGIQQPGQQHRGRRRTDELFGLLEHQAVSLSAGRGGSGTRAAGPDLFFRILCPGRGECSRIGLSAGAAVLSTRCGGGEEGELSRQQAVAWRALAASYFNAEPFLNPDEGRRCYQASIDIILSQKQRGPLTLFIPCFSPIGIGRMESWWRRIEPRLRKGWRRPRNILACYPRGTT